MSISKHSETEIIITHDPVVPPPTIISLQELRDKKQLAESNKHTLTQKRNSEATELARTDTLIAEANAELAEIESLIAEAERLEVKDVVAVAPVEESFTLI